MWNKADGNNDYSYEILKYFHSQWSKWITEGNVRYVIKYFVLKISWIGFLSNVVINLKLHHTATAPYCIHWYTYILSVLIYNDSDRVARFVTWVRESMIIGGGLSHAIATSLHVALFLSSRETATLPPEVSFQIISLTAELRSCRAF